MNRCIESDLEPGQRRAPRQIVKMTRRLASQPPPASPVTAPRALRSRPHPVRTPLHGCVTAAMPEASAWGSMPACRACRAALCSAKARPAPRWSASNGSAQTAGGVRTQSWQGRGGSVWGSIHGDSGDVRASAAQGPADISRRWEGEEAQRDWTPPAAAVTPDTGLIEVCLCLSCRTIQPALYITSSLRCTK